MRLCQFFLSRWKESWANLTTHPHSTHTSTQESLLYTARPANRLLLLSASPSLTPGAMTLPFHPVVALSARLQHPQFLPRRSSSSRSLPFSVHTRSILLELRSWNPCQSVESEPSESPTRLSWTTTFSAGFGCKGWLALSHTLIFSANSFLTT